MLLPQLPQIHHGSVHPETHTHMESKVLKANTHITQDSLFKGLGKSSVCVGEWVYVLECISFQRNKEICLKEIWQKNANINMQEPKILKKLQRSLDSICHRANSSLKPDTI